MKEDKTRRKVGKSCFFVDSLNAGGDIGVKQTVVGAKWEEHETHQIMRCRRLYLTVDSVLQ